MACKSAPMTAHSLYTPGSLVSAISTTCHGASRRVWAVRRKKPPIPDPAYTPLAVPPLPLPPDRSDRSTRRRFRRSCLWAAWKDHFFFWYASHAWSSSYRCANDEINLMIKLALSSANVLDVHYSCKVTVIWLYICGVHDNTFYVQHHIYHINFIGSWRAPVSIAVNSIRKNRRLLKTFCNNCLLRSTGETDKDKFSWKVPVTEGHLYVFLTVLDSNVLPR